MVGICFKYDPGYKSLLRDQFYELVLAFPNITNVYERNGMDSRENLEYQGIPYTSVINADNLPTEPTLVILSAQDGEFIQGNNNLAGYVHPADVIYYFGSDHQSLDQAEIGITTDYVKVYIPISENVWSAQAVAMVLYDRQSKI